MKTDDLVKILATQAGPCKARRMWPGIALAAGWGGLFAMVLMLIFLGIRPDIAQAVFSPPLWMKLALPALLAVGSMAGLNRLTRPGVRFDHLGAWLACPSW